MSLTTPKTACPSGFGVAASPTVLSRRLGPGETGPVGVITGGSCPSSNAAVSLTITWSEQVTGFVEGDVTLVNATISSWTEAVTGLSYTFTLTASSEGAFSATIPAEVCTAVSDSSNNRASSYSCTYDNTNPTTTLSGGADVANGETASYTVTFSESVTGFALGDLSVTNGTASNLQGSGSVYTFDMTAADDTLVTVYVNASAAQDAAGNNSAISNTIQTAFGDANNPESWGDLQQHLFKTAASTHIGYESTIGKTVVYDNSEGASDTWRELRAGRGYQGDGANEYVDLPSELYDAIEGGTEGSLVLWGDIQAANTIIALDMWGGSSSTRFSLFTYTDGNIYVVCGAGQGTVSFSDTGSHCFVFVFNGSGATDADKIKLYVDGVEQSLSFSGTIASVVPSLTAAYLGSLTFTGVKSSGIQHEAAVYSSALTTDEIDAIVASHTYSTTNLEALYWCDEEGGDICIDASGNGRNGTINGTLADIHQADTDATYNSANSLGHLVADGSTHYYDSGLTDLIDAGVIVPRDESNTTKACCYDSGGQSDLTNTGRAQHYGVAQGSACITGDDVADEFEAASFYIPGSLEAFSYSFNIVSPASHTGNGYVFSCLGPGGAFPGMDCWLNSGIPRFRLIETVTTSEIQITPSTAVPVNAITQVTYTYDGSGNASGVKLYYNGVEQTLPAASIDNLGSGDPSGATAFHILSQGGSTYLSADYSIFGLRIWSRELTASQVTDLNNGTILQTDIEHNYPCTERYGDILHDVSGNERHAIATGTLADIWANTHDGYAHNWHHGHTLAAWLDGSSGAANTATQPAATGALEVTATCSTLTGVPHTLVGCEVSTNLLAINLTTGGTIEGKVGTTTLTSTTTVSAGEEFTATLKWAAAGSAISLEINGTEEDSDTYSGSLPSGQPLSIGAMNDDGTDDQFFPGLVKVVKLYDTDQTTVINQWRPTSPGQTVIPDSVGSDDATLNGTQGTNWEWIEVPGNDGVEPDGSTATQYDHCNDTGKMNPTSSQLDRTGGVSHPAANANSWDVTYESGDAQTNPEYVRSDTDGDDRFLAYAETLTGQNATDATAYTTP